MRIIGLLGAGALAVGTVAAMPAEAQRYGWDQRDGRGWHDGGRRGWRDDRGYHRGYRDGYRDYHRGGRGWRGDRGYYGRPRVTCRWVRTPWGPEQRCRRR